MNHAKIAMNRIHKSIYIFCLERNRYLRKNYNRLNYKKRLLSLELNYEQANSEQMKGKRGKY